MWFYYNLNTGITNSKSVLYDEVHEIETQKFWVSELLGKEEKRNCHYCSNTWS